MQGAEIITYTPPPPVRRVGCSHTWNFRRAGGLYLGLRVDFPTSIIYDDGTVRRTLHISVGLLVWTWRIEFRGKPRV